MFLWCFFFFFFRSLILRSQVWFHCGKQYHVFRRKENLVIFFILVINYRYIGSRVYKKTRISIVRLLKHKTVTLTWIIYVISLLFKSFFFPFQIFIWPVNFQRLGYSLPFFRFLLFFHWNFVFDLKEKIIATSDRNPKKMFNRNEHNFSIYTICGFSFNWNQSHTMN